MQEVVQESLGFSPAELVFGLTVCGLLKVLQEIMLSEANTQPKPPQSILRYVSDFKERLHKTPKCAKQHLSGSQVKMKKCFDTKAVMRTFQPGDKV